MIGAPVPPAEPKSGPKLVIYRPSPHIDSLLPAASLVILPPNHFVTLGCHISWSDDVLGAVPF